ncbi:MAG: M13 family metallopeptidase [Caulobacteraceae bacterium]
MKRLWLCAASACALSASPLLITHTFAADTNTPASASLEAPRMGTWGFDLANRDPATKAGDDFFRFADGKGVDAMTIPADRSRFGAFDTLVELSSARSRALIESPGNGAPGSEEAKIKALYASFMDEKTLAALDAKPLKPELDAIKAVTTREQMARLMGKGAVTFYGGFFGAYVGADAKDPDHYAVILGQSGLNLPDRDYYLTDQFAAKKQKYQAYVADTLERIGWRDPKATAKQIVDLETEIAKVSWTKVEQRDDNKMYNPMTPAELGKLAPGFPWQAYFTGAELPPLKRVIVGEKTAFPKIAAIYAKTPIATLKAWQAFTLTSNASSSLSQRFDQAHFQFYSHDLQGVPAQRERWKRATSLVSGQMGEALGHLYVDKYFPAESKARMLSLVGDLRTALGERIKKLDWMSDATKAKAQAKLGMLNVKIGYPNKWRDYSALVSKPDDLYGNVERGGAFEWRFRVGRLDKPVDRDEWDMTPQTVNAYYDPSKNEIVFPAAILAPPFFDPQADMAINYGAIGGVIGHEMTHGFDDQGRQYDGTGKLTDWWTKEDSDRFDARAKQLVAQYSAFEPLPGAHVNGGLTLGENIADLGGLLLALDAYHASLHGQPAPVIDGLTGDQRVFLGWAQVWKSKIRDDALRQRMATDPHSPDMLRVNGVVHNVDGWYGAYDVRPGDKLYLAPDQRVRIW